MTAMAGRWRVSAWALLTLGALGCLIYGLVPMGDAGATVLYQSIATLGTAMTVAGIWQSAHPGRRVWVALAVGQVLYCIGDVLWDVYDYVLNVSPYPSPADAAYLLRYVFCAVALGWLIRGRRRGRDRAAFLDAAIVSTAFAVVACVFLVAPTAAQGGQTLLSKVVAGAYPVADVLLLA